MIRKFITVLSSLTILICMNFSSPNKNSNRNIKYANEDIHETIDANKYKNYLCIESNSISFDEEGYKSYISTLNLTIEEKLKEKQEIEYLSSSTKTIQKLLKNHVGIISKDGTFKPYEEYSKPKAVNNEVDANYLLKTLCKESNQFESIIYPIFTKALEFFYSEFCYEWSWNIFSGFNITLGKSGTLFIGLLGVLVNCISLLKSLNEQFLPSEIISPKMYLEMDCLSDPNPFYSYIKDMFNNLLNDGVFQQFVSNLNEIFKKDINEFVSLFSSLFFVGLAIIKTINSATGVGIIMDLLFTIIGLYLPSLLTGIEMIYRSFEGTVTTYSNIGLFWSSYELTFIGL